MLLTKVSKKKKLPKQWKILAETYLIYAPLASFVTPSSKDHEVRDRLAHTTDDVVKKARCACTHDVIQDGAENAEERRKVSLSTTAYPRTTESPRLGCVLLTSNVINWRIYCS